MSQAPSKFPFLLLLLFLHLSWLVLAISMLNVPINLPDESFRKPDDKRKYMEGYI